MRTAIKAEGRNSHALICQARAVFTSSAGKPVLVRNRAAQSMIAGAGPSRLCKPSASPTQTGCSERLLPFQARTATCAISATPDLIRHRNGTWLSRAAAITLRA